MVSGTALLPQLAAYNQSVASSSCFSTAMTLHRAVLPSSSPRYVFRGAIRSTIVKQLSISVQLKKNRTELCFLNLARRGVVFRISPVTPRVILQPPPPSLMSLSIAVTSLFFFLFTIAFCGLTEIRFLLQMYRNIRHTDGT